ncbi:MAG: profilin [Campylobacterota bacterium]|nr:profilin [Campylobacterota bacterium]
MLDWDYQLDIISEYSKDSTGAVNASKVSILSLKDGTILNSVDQDNSFNISQNEARVIANIFKTKEFTAFKSDGITIEDINYKFINSVDERIVFAKKEYVGTLSMQSTNTTVIIGFTQDGYHQSNTNLAIKNIVKYFEQIDL